MKKTIFLIGYMGSGKSVIGRNLSKAISYAFYDLDNFITTKEGLTINEIFEQKRSFILEKLKENI